jgi:hypothetical protein
LACILAKHHFGGTAEQGRHAHEEQEGEDDRRRNGEEEPPRDKLDHGCDPYAEQDATPFSSGVIDKPLNPDAIFLLDLPPGKALRILDLRLPRVSCSSLCLLIV